MNNTEQRQADEAAHTPTPWKTYGLYRQSDGHNGVMVGEGGMTVCEVISGTLCPPEVRDANAAFIVRACNEYAANKDLLASYEARDARNVAALNKSDEENERLKAKCAGLAEALAYCRNRAKGLQAELLEPGGRAPISISELSDIENKARAALAAAKL